MLRSSTRLQFRVYFWARNNKAYLKIDIYLNHASTPFPVCVTITYKQSHWFVLQIYGMVSIQWHHCESQTPPFPYIIFDFIEDIIYLFPQRSQAYLKHNTKGKNWKTIQQ